MNDFSNRTFVDAHHQVIPYDGSPVKWRVSAYAVVIRDNQLLVVKHNWQTYYDVPGGGVELGETLTETVEREGLEEAGAKFRLGDVFGIKQDWFFHQAEHQFYQALQVFYKAELQGELLPPTQADIVEVTWLSLTENSLSQLQPNVVELLRNAHHVT